MKVDCECLCYWLLVARSKAASCHTYSSSAEVWNKRTRQRSAAQSPAASARPSLLHRTRLRIAHIVVLLLVLLCVCDAPCSVFESS